MSISVVVPTLNPGELLLPLAQALSAQSMKPDEWIVVDSSSDDGTPARARRLGATVIEIPRAAFTHGGARNLGAARSSGTIIVFLTQDALPLGEDWLLALTRRIRSGEAAAAYSRHVPKPHATVQEQYARSVNYPPSARLVAPCDLGPGGVRAVFFSNASSAIARSAFEEVGGFSSTTIMNEDMLLAHQLLLKGRSIAYAADSRVLHSHTYGHWDTFRRYFDIGVFFATEGNAIAFGSASPPARRYALGLLAHLVERRAWGAMAGAIIDLGARWCGHFVGRRHGVLPGSVSRRLSMHRAYWAPKR